MRHALLALIPTLLSAANFQIDHVTVCGADLKTLQSALNTEGIPTVYGGKHANGATEMALVSFPDGGYVELIAPLPGATGDQLPWIKQMQGNAGPCAWALAGKDIGTEVKRLSAAGVPVGEPVPAGRQRPDGVRLEWSTSVVGAEPRGTFFPFLIQDHTPRKQRVYPDGKPVTTDFKGIIRVVIAVRNLDAAVKRYRDAYGLPAPIKQVDKEFGGQLALVGSAPVVLVQPLTQDSWLAERIDQFGEGPCAFVLAANRPSRYRAASSTRWFGIDIAWLDHGKLGWRLGFERAR
jgi:catechol 2,3-dioxygenase-like lactoylglutathione lyase family enzyme